MFYDHVGLNYEPTFYYNPIFAIILLAGFLTACPVFLAFSAVNRSDGTKKDTVINI